MNSPPTTSPNCDAEGPCYTSYSDSTSYTVTPTSSTASSPNIPTYTSSTANQVPAPTTTSIVSTTGSENDSLLDNKCTKIPANPDISGIGVRVSFYLLVCIISVIPRLRKTEPLLHSLRGILGLGGFALLLASIIETSKGRLSLYHAMMINSLLYFYWIVLIASRSFSFILSSRGSAGTLKFVILTIVSMFCMSGWLLAVWKNPRTFGPSAECNDQLRIFVFGWRSPTGTALRGFMMFLAVFLMILALLALGGVVWALNRGSDGGANSTEQDTKEQNGFLGSYAAQLPTLYLVPVVFGIGLIEAYVKKNRHLVEAGEEKWTFGQVVAIITVLGALNEILNFLVPKSYSNDVASGSRGSGEKA